MNDDPRDLYLDLMKRVLTGSGFGTDRYVPLVGRGWKRRVVEPLNSALVRRGFAIARKTPPSSWPPLFDTMVPVGRLTNVQTCIETVLRDEIPGDFIETGVWRGGTTIFMRAVLAAYGVTDRLVWAADSFAGFPSDRLEIDRADDFTAGLGEDYLAVDLAAVKANFAKYGLLDEQVKFLVGWFKDTLPAAPLQKLAVARLDGDLFESTRDAVSVLEPKVSRGGFVIVDDYGRFGPCREAIDEYRTSRGISEPIEVIDDQASFWRKG